MRNVPYRKIYLTSLSLALTSYLLCIAVLMGGPQMHAQDRNGSHVLTDADVIKMVGAHLSTDIILGQIRDNPGNYSLTTDKLIYLKEVGVPDSVISAMQAKAAASTTGGAAPAPARNAPANRVDAGNAARPAGAAQANRPVSLQARPLTGQPGGAETFAPQTCPNLETDKILLLNFLRLEPSALDDEATLRQFVNLNNKCEQQYTPAQLANELEYPDIARAYKAKAAEILSGVPSEITLESSGVAFGQYDAARGGFPVDATNALLREVGSGFHDVTDERVEFSPASTLFPGSYRPIAFLKFRWTPFVFSELPMSESDAKKFLAQLLQSSDAAKAQARSNMMSMQSMGMQGAIVPDTTRTIYPVAKIKILPVPPRIVTMSSRNGGYLVKTFTVELSGQLSEISIAMSPSYQHTENAPLTVLHPDPTASETEQQAESFLFRKQYAQALLLAERACKSGYPRGCGLEGYLYALGLGVTADVQHGANLLYGSCENYGDGASCYLSAAAYQKIGRVTLVDSVGGRHDAFEPGFTKSCTEGFPDGCFQIAESEYKMAAQNCSSENCPATQSALMALDNACETGIQQSTAECGGGVSFGCGNLAMCYLRGAGVNKDPAKAKQFFEQGCSLGDKEQCEEARSGVLSANAQGGAGPGQGAASPIQNAPDNAPVPHPGIVGRAFSKELAKCNAGDGGACDHTGFDLANGWGVDKNLQSAKQFYEKSCAMGSRHGCSDAKNAQVN